jgi:hypothetical protein
MRGRPVALDACNLRQHDCVCWRAPIGLAVSRSRIRRARQRHVPQMIRRRLRSAPLIGKRATIRKARRGCHVRVVRGWSGVRSWQRAAALAGRAGLAGQGRCRPMAVPNKPLADYSKTRRPFRAYVPRQDHTRPTVHCFTCCRSESWLSTVRFKSE